MPFVRIKPYSPAKGYKLRSFQSRDGLRLVMGDDLENPKWYECSAAQARYLSMQRVNKLDPSSACKFDILPDKAAADALVKAEKARRNKQDEGTSVDRAIPLSDEARARNAKHESELEALKAKVAAQEAELAALRMAAGGGVPAASPDLMAEYKAAEEAGGAPESQPEPAAAPRSSTITSAITGAAKRPVAKK